jgi:hypothetical protein
VAERTDTDPQGKLRCGPYLIEGGYPRETHLFTSEIYDLTPAPPDSLRNLTVRGRETINFTRALPMLPRSSLDSLHVDFAWLGMHDPRFAAPDNRLRGNCVRRLVRNQQQTKTRRRKKTNGRCLDWSCPGSRQALKCSTLSQNRSCRWNWATSRGSHPSVQYLKRV